MFHRNDFFIYGASQLACYEPIFGYRLERFPFGRINTGEVLDDSNGVFNIKNPVCYVFGNVNGCIPGEHFTSDNRKNVEDFVNYKPLKFRMPLLQTIANWVNIITLICVVFFLLLFMLNKFIYFNRVVK